MRQLKTFMRNRKAEMLWCGPCECRTLQCWRYANENCGCGENIDAERLIRDDFEGQDEAGAIRIKDQIELIWECQGDYGFWCRDTITINGRGYEIYEATSESSAHFRTTINWVKYVGHVSIETDEDTDVYKAVVEEIDKAWKLWDNIYFQGDVNFLQGRFFATSNNAGDYITWRSSDYFMEWLWIFDSEWWDALIEILSSAHEDEHNSSMRYTPFIFWKDWTMPADWKVAKIDAKAMALVKKVLENPTEANKQNLITAIDTAIDKILQEWNLSASFATYEEGAGIQIIPGSSISSWETNKMIAAAIITGSATESLIVSSNDTSILDVRVEKVVEVPMNARQIYWDWISAWTVTVTVTWVENPTLTASFDVDVLR